MEKMEIILRNIGKTNKKNNNTSNKNSEKKDGEGKTDEEKGIKRKHTKWLKNVNKRKIERCFRHISNGSSEKELTYNDFVQWFMESDDTEINNIIVHHKLYEILHQIF